MVSQLLQCPTSDGCPAYPYVGFQNPDNRYGSVTICDWDCCLYGTGINNDSVIVPGYGTLYQPTPPADPNCLNGDNLRCAGASCHIDDNGNNVVDSTWNGYVDGHITYTALDDCYVKVTEGAGDPLINNPIGTILPFSNNNILSSLGQPQSDQYAYSNIYNNVCNNTNANNIFFVLGTPSPNNT
jgi:hypothetical protein